VTEPLSGGQFSRAVGTDPRQWAERFLEAYASAPIEETRTEADRIAWVAGWFRCAMDAAASNVDRAERQAGKSGHGVD